MLDIGNVGQRQKTGRPAVASECDKLYFIRIAENPENRRAIVAELIEGPRLNISSETG